MCKGSNSKKGKTRIETQTEVLRVCVNMFNLLFTFVNDGPIYLNDNHDPQYGQIEAKLYSLETSQYLLFYERGVHKANQM